MGLEDLVQRLVAASLISSHAHIDRGGDGEKSFSFERDIIINNTNIGDFICSRWNWLLFSRAVGHIGILMYHCYLRIGKAPRCECQCKTKKLTIAMVESWSKGKKILLYHFRHRHD